MTTQRDIVTLSYRSGNIEHASKVKQRIDDDCNGAGLHIKRNLLSQSVVASVDSEQAIWSRKY